LSSNELAIGLAVVVAGCWVYVWSRLYLSLIAADVCIGNDAGWWRQACWISTSDFWLALVGITAVLSGLNLASAWLTIPVVLAAGVLVARLMAVIPLSQAYWAAVNRSLRGALEIGRPDQRDVFYAVQDRLLAGTGEQRNEILDRIIEGSSPQPSAPDLRGVTLLR
jgi:hypothetical protein